VLRPADGLRKVLTISAIQAIAKRGVPLAKAKRTIEDMVSQSEAFVHVPTVESEQALDSELRAAGVQATLVAATQVDVKALRARLGLTQEQFALRFGLDIDAVQNWEQGRCQPDRPALAYLRAIAAAPETVAKAQERELV
jgi:putative transcriptional regulator